MTDDIAPQTVCMIEAVPRSQPKPLSAFGAIGDLAIGLEADSSASQWIGAISEIGIATGWHDATTVASLDSYLQTKWGL